MSTPEMKKMCAVYLEPEMVRQIDELAKENCRSRNAQMTWIFKVYLEQVQSNDE